MKTLTTAITLSCLLLATAISGDYSGKGISGKAITGKGVVHKADCLSYDFIDLDYSLVESDNVFLDDGSRYGISFSKSLGPVLYLTGSYSRAENDLFFGNRYYDVDSDVFSLGLGAHFSLAECVDLTLEGGLSYLDAEYGGIGGFDYDSWGYYIGPGLRARWGRLEGYAKLLYIEREGVFGPYGAAQEGWVFQPGLLYHLNETVALKVGADLAESNSAVTFGARIHF